MKKLLLFLTVLLGLTLTSTAADYKLVTSSSELEIGANYIIASGTEGDAYALGTQGGNNCTAISVSVTNSIISNPSAEVRVFLLAEGTVDNTYGFFDSNSNGYLYAASSSKNYLRTETTLTANSSASIAIDGSSYEATIIFQGSNTRNMIRYNSSSTLFSCYSSGQNPVYLFKEFNNTSTPTLAAPTFNPENGFEFTSPFELTITAEAGATIYYTLDGNDPTTESDVYSAPIEISETTTVKAYAVADGYTDSPIATATYNYVDPNAVTKSICIKASGVAEPAGYSFPNEGLVNDSGYDFGGFNVKFSNPSTGAVDKGGHVRFYTGEILTITPPEGRTIKRVELNVVANTGTITSTIGTCSGAGGDNQIWEGRTTEALQLTATAQIRFSYMTITYEESSDAIQTLATPTFSHEDGFEFTSSFDLTITAEDGATIYYTLDGNDPTTESDVYSAPITISETTTVKVYAVADGFNDSPIATATYTYVDLNSITKYGLVTSADQLVVDGNYLIAYNAVAMGAQLGDYFDKVDINAASNGIISISTEEVNPVTLGGEAGAWAFKTALEDKYLYWSTGNTLTTYDTLMEGVENGVKWTISIEANYTAKIGSNHTNNADGKRFLQYNAGSPRFACYTSAQKVPSLYAEMKYIYICDETEAGDVEIISIVDSEDAAVTYSALETGEWALTRAENTYNKRYAYVPSNGTYTITYQYTKNDELTTDVREFAADQEAAFITFSDDTITGIDGINADNNAPVEYFNMQGIRVANPENGLFIRRQGNKVEKIIL